MTLDWETISHSVALGGAPLCVTVITLTQIALNALAASKSEHRLVRYLAQHVCPKVNPLSGVIASLPFVVGPMLLGAALLPGQIDNLDSPLFARNMAHNSLIGVLGYLSFLVTATLVCGPIEAYFTRRTAALARMECALRIGPGKLHGWLAGTAVVGMGVIAFALVGGVMLAPVLRVAQRLMSVPPLALAVLLSLLLVLLYRGLWHTPPMQTVPRSLSPLQELILRPLMALAIAYGVFMLRKKAPGISGYAGVFPTATSVIVWACMANSRAAGVQSLMRGMLCGSSGLIWFLTALTLTLDNGTIGPSFGLASVCALTGAGLTYLLINPEKRAAVLGMLGRLVGAQK